MRLLVRGARLVDETRDEAGDLLVEDGRIERIGAPGGVASGHWLLAGEPATVIDGEGLVLMPAFVDLHAHFRDPGYPLKENLESGSLAAAAGGYATVVCMANTQPVMSEPGQVSALKARADALGLVDLRPAVSFTRGFDGVDVSHLAAFGPVRDPLQAPVLVASEDGRDVADPAVFERALRECARLGLLASCHCEDEATKADNRVAEDKATLRALETGRRAGCRLHVAHVSTVASVDAVRAAKRAPASTGGSISCEATPHHVALTDALDYRVNPWLRTEADRKAVVAGLVDGTIDAIATDHAPHTAEDKTNGAPGISGIESSFALCHEALVASGIITLGRLSALMSANPARLLGLSDRGRLEEGLRADLVLVDPDAVWTLDPAEFKSRGRNTPIAGRAMRGRVIMTICKGRITHAL